MTTAKWILCVIAASIISSYVTFHLNQFRKNDLNAVSNIENFTHLKSSNVNSTEQHQEIEISLNKATHLAADTGLNNANHIQPTKIEDLQFAYEKRQNEIASFREFTERTGNNALSVISENYDSEPLDPEWARSKEDELIAILDTNETLQNTAPLELSCKSQNCRLVLSAHDENQSESFYSAFKDGTLQGSDENNKQVITSFRKPDSGEIHIYLSRSTVTTLLNGTVD